MSSRLHAANMLHGEDDDLRYLLEKYLQRAEELEKRENKVLKQIELMQSAVASLQDWNQSRKASRSSSEPVKIDVNEIEEETRLIKEETTRIQKEIQEKMEENRKLEAEVTRRKTLQSEASLRIKASESDRSDEGIVDNRKMRETTSSKQDSDPEIDYFEEKLHKLKQMEQKMVKESELKSEELKRKQQDLKDKIDMLEWESRIDKQLIETLKKKSAK